MIVVDRLDKTDEAGFRELGDFLLPMAAEVAVVPIDAKTAAEQLWLAVAQGNAFVARATDDDTPGRIVGSLALVRDRYWYNMNRSFFIDHHFYVGREARFALVGVRLLRAAREQVLPKGDAVFVRVANARRHQKATPEAYYATIAGYFPVGHMTVIRPATDESIVVEDAGKAA